jgi:quercetin dioxygenase-like cupin family protein
MNRPAENVDDRPYFVRHGGGIAVTPFPGVALRTTPGDALMVSVVSLEEGAVVPDHSHPHEQMGYLVSGRLEFTVGGRTEVLGPGDVWRIPGGVPHRVVAVGGPAVAIDVFHPVREDYLGGGAARE